MKNYIEKIYSEYSNIYEKANIDPPIWLKEKKLPDVKATVNVGEDISLEIDGPVDSFLGVDLKPMIIALEANPEKDVSLKINTPGGSYFEAMALYGALSAHEGKVTTIAQGIAASAGAYLFLAGDERLMNEGAMIMSHGVQIGAMFVGGETDFKDFSSEMKTRFTKLNQNVREIMAEKITADEKTKENLVMKDTFLTADEAIEINFATGKYKNKNKDKAETEVSQFQFSAEQYDAICAELRDRFIV